MRATTRASIIISSHVVGRKYLTNVAGRSAIVWTRVHYTCMLLMLSPATPFTPACCVRRYWPIRYRPAAPPALSGNTGSGEPGDP